MKIIFGAICKNIEPEIFNCINFLAQALERFPDSHVCIYENNSTDNTKTYMPLLQNIAAPGRVHILSEDMDVAAVLEASAARTWDNKTCRMELIALARNKLLDMINAVGYTDDDRIVMFDPDIVAVPNIDAIANCIAREDADVIFANGLNASKTAYYDMYAYRCAAIPLGPELRGEEFWKTLKYMAITSRTPVYSAFGGLGIYRGACLKDNRYSAVPTKDLDDMNRSLVVQHGIEFPKPVTHHEGCLMGVYLFGKDGFFYHNNSGHNYPVVCEHSTFHARMYNRGQRRMYIDPDLKYFSGH